MELRIAVAIVLVWMVLFVVPVIVYGAVSAVTGLKPPGNAPMQFLLGTAISKLGTAIAFVGVFALARDVLAGQWLAYAGLWWLMFVVGEIGQAVTPAYSRQEAAAGIVSETIYFPVVGAIVLWLLGA